MGPKNSLDRFYPQVVQRSNHWFALGSSGWEEFFGG
jgi:hypothetical protein